MERAWTIAAGAVIGLLLIASIVVSLLRGETEFDSGSPQAVVQQYIRALAEEDFDAARSLWSPDLREHCSLETFVTDSRYDVDRMDEARYTLGAVRTVGETASVEIEITHTSGGGIFGPSEYSRTGHYSLRSYDEGWLVTSHTTPRIECVSSRPTPSPLATPTAGSG